MRTNTEPGTGFWRKNRSESAASGRDLTAQFIGNMGVNDVVERGLGPEAERHRTGGIKAARPAGDGATDARHGQIDARTEFCGVETSGVNKEADSRAWARMPVQHAVLNREQGLFTGERLADDRGEEPRGRLVRPAGPHHDAGQSYADAVDKAAPRVIGEQQLDH